MRRASASAALRRASSSAPPASQDLGDPALRCLDLGGVFRVELLDQLHLVEPPLHPLLGRHRQFGLAVAGCLEVGEYPGRLLAVGLGRGGCLDGQEPPALQFLAQLAQLVDVVDAAAGGEPGQSLLAGVLPRVGVQDAQRSRRGLERHIRLDDSLPQALLSRG